jgi:hypothetical protein
VKIETSTINIIKPNHHKAKHMLTAPYVQKQTQAKTPAIIEQYGPVQYVELSVPKSQQRLGPMFCQPGQQEERHCVGLATRA